MIDPGCGRSPYIAIERDGKISARIDGPCPPEQFCSPFGRVVETGPDIVGSGNRRCEVSKSKRKTVLDCDIGLGASGAVIEGDCPGCCISPIDTRGARCLVDGEGVVIHIGIGNWGEKLCPPIPRSLSLTIVTVKPFRDAGAAHDLEIKGHHFPNIHILVDRPIQRLRIGPTIPLRIIGKR